MEWNQDNQQPNRESGSLATRKSELIHVSNRELAADPAEIHVHHYHVNIANRKIFLDAIFRKGTQGQVVISIGAIWTN
jgi:hypothetical protein